MVIVRVIPELNTFAGDIGDALEITRRLCGKTMVILRVILGVR